MQIDLFTCSCERNRIDKTSALSNRFTLQGAFRRATSAMNIEVDVEKTNPVIYKYNYMYIAEFNRWYYIEDISTVRTNLWTIKGKVDVLMSFSTDIFNSRVIVDKIQNEEVANLYLDDGSFVMDSRKYNEVIEFPSGLNETGSYILICAGGI